MADKNLGAPLLAALETAGAQILDSDKAKVEAFIEPLADADANAIINAIASHISLNGMAGMVQTPLRNALVGAQPTVDKVINDNVNGGFDALESLLTEMAKSV